MKPKSAPSILNTAKWIVTWVAAIFSLAMPVFAQMSPAGALGSGLGGGLFDATASVLFKTMKAPGSTVDIGPKRLEFIGVRVNKSSLNVMTITNGTNHPIEIKSVSMPSTGFRIFSRLPLPLAIPPQTQALLTVEFLPTRSGEYSGEAEVRYETAGSDKLRKMGITLKGKGVPK